MKSRISASSTGRMTSGTRSRSRPGSSAARDAPSTTTNGSGFTSSSSSSSGLSAPSSDQGTSVSAPGPARHSRSGSSTGNAHQKKEAARTGLSGTDERMTESDLTSLVLTAQTRMDDPFIRACLVQILGPKHYERLSTTDIASELGTSTYFVRACLSALRRELKGAA